MASGGERTISHIFAHPHPIDLPPAHFRITLKTGSGNMEKRKKGV